MTYKLVYGLLDQGRDFKQELSGGGVNLKIFPEAEGLVTCTMEGVKPSSSQEAELVNNLISKLLLLVLHLQRLKHVGHGRWLKTWGLGLAHGH